MEKNAAKFLSDQELMILIVGGQLSLFDICFKRHRKAVIDFLQKRTYNKEDAEDLAQEVFVKAYHFIEKGRYDLEQSYIKSWLISIAKNHYVDWFRQKKSRPLLCRDEGLILQAHNEHSHSATPERIFITKESIMVIRSLTAKLSPREAELIQLRFIEDLSYAGMAKLLCVTEETVKAILFRARKKLKKKLLQKGAA